MEYKYLKAFLLLIVLNILFGLQAFAQHDLNGLWAKRAAFGSGGSANIITSTTDDDKNVFVTGYFSGNLNFSDDICSAQMHQASNALSGSGFLSKYDDNGKYQWTVIGSPTATSTYSTSAMQVNILDRKDDKLLVLVKIGYLSSTLKPLEIKLTGPVNTKTLSKGTVDGSGAGGNVHTAAFLQIVNCNTGELEQTIDAFITGTHDVFAKFSNDNKVHILHWGAGSLYPGLRSSYTIYDLSTSSTIASAIYPDQPIIGSIPDTRVRGNVSLANGDNCIHQMTFNWSNYAWTTSHIILYSNDMATYKLRRAVDPNAEVVQGELATDGGNNIYFMSHYGNKAYPSGGGSSGVPPGKNTLTSFLGSGENFQTKDGYRKLIISKLKPDLTCEWLFQIGDNSLTNNDVVSGSAIRNDGAYVYVAGEFNGQNVNFDPIGNNSKWFLSSNGGLDGFYAIYENNTGKCVYAVKIGGTKDDNITTISLAGNKVLLGGTYISPAFQTDPADRLYELSNNGTTKQAFITLYSNVPQSAPMPKISFGDAPESYGLAVHHASECLRIGELDLAKTQDIPVHSINANVAENDIGSLDIATNMDGSVDLKNMDLQLNSSNGELTAVVKVHNNTLDDAKIIGSFDFNKNGVFDGASEASTVVTVPKNTTAPTATVTLKWAGAAAKIRDGQTYMRLRITSDNMDATQPQGLFFNGEVEDYGVRLNLLQLDKAVFDKNMVSISEANVGDTITYIISPTTSIIAKNVTLFDPIPEYTKFVDADEGKTPTNVTLHGETYKAVVWNLPDFSSTSNLSYSFRVVITDKPKNSDSIYNIAFGVINGDTINSAQATCNIAGVKVNKLVAKNDYYAVFSRDSIMAAPISLNDTDPYRAVVRDTILKVWHGTAEMNEPRDGTLKYVAPLTFGSNRYGLDSIDYRIKTVNDSADAKVYIAVIHPESQKYYACPGAAVTIEVAPAAHPLISYSWFTTHTGGAPITVNSNKTTIIMGNASVTYYIEVKIDGNTVEQRLPITVNLGDCGSTNPVGCPVDGTLLFREDFGGNEVSHPFIKPSGIPQVIGYTYQPNVSGYGTYALRKEASKGKLNTHWEPIDDHTSPLDKKTGYMLQVDAGKDPGQFYVYQIDNLCPDTKLYFSAWITSVTTMVAWNNNYRDAPNLAFILEDLSGNILSKYYTSDLSILETEWKQYGFKFDLPSGHSSLIFRIINNGKGSNGNDFAIDDIEVRLCTPPINLTVNDIEICSESKLELEATYDEDCTFGNNLTYRWEYRAEDATVWTSLEQNDIIVDCAHAANNRVQKSYVINSATKNNEGYYRMLISKQGNINLVNCRASSDLIFVKILNKEAVMPDVRIQLCPDAGKIAHLSSYIDSTNFNLISWAQASPLSPAITGGSGRVAVDDFLSGVYMYTYTMTNKCGSYDGKLYVKTLTNNVMGLPPDTVTICQEDKSAAHINLNRIVGIEAGGNWLFDNTVNPDNTVSDNTLLSVAPAVHQGAHTFNATKAWRDAGAAYLVPGGYHGDMNAKMFKFQYITPALSCIGATTKEVIIVVTENIVF